MANSTDADHGHPKLEPAPWINKGEIYFFFLSTPSKPPEGAYAPLEATSYFASPEAGAFRGGPLGSATVQVLRYTESPTGPYDELVYLPGAFDNPSGKPHLRVTRMYVSTNASIYNGRSHWNIAKHLARFTFTPLSSTHDANASIAANRHSPIKIEVFPPTSHASTDAPPFFSAIATPSTWLPNFPFNTRYFPHDLLLVHPPLPAGRDHDGDDPSSVVGTDHWVSVLPEMRGKGEFMWYTPGGSGKATEGEGVPCGEYADGVGFPKFKPWRMGIHIRNLVLDFPESRPLVDDKKKSI